MQNLSCENEFYLRDDKKSYSDQWFCALLLFETGLSLEATRKWSIVMTLPSFKWRGAGYESVCYGINNTRPT